MQILLSQPLVETLRRLTKESVASLIEQKIEPHLAVILIGQDPESLRYITLKTEAAEQLGIILSLYHIQEDESLSEVENTIRFLNQDEEVHGIIVQLPLPEPFLAQTDHILSLIAPEKDVDGLTKDWQKQKDLKAEFIFFLSQVAYTIPPMVGAVFSLLDFYKIPLEGKSVVVVGRGRLVGGPIAHFLKELKVSVQVVNEETEGILAITQQADILITGTGQKDLITYQWIKEGAVVIDCAGDTHFDSVSQLASAMAPPTGGVGPLTVSWLLYHTVMAAKKLTTPRRTG